MCAMETKVKPIHVPYLEDLDRKMMHEVCLDLENKGARGAIDQVNWPKRFPYAPIASFCIAHNEKSLFIRFHVNGNCLRAVHSRDQEPVCEDSCVEFFCQIPGQPYYWNFEFNCIGTCRATHRLSRNEEKVMISEDELKRIKRYASAGKRPFCEMIGTFDWEIAVEIPFSILGIGVCLPEKLRANFYKCADLTEEPHYLSWSPIDSPEPDFHRPDCFGELILDRKA